jgi:membrane-bound ClpP family serine protease
MARDDWLDKVAEFFREPLVNVLLIMLGIAGLILELKMPGIGFPGVIAAVCFVLFFWAHSFVGQFTMLAVLLFVLGLILIGLEIFVLPGFGVTGISGIVLLVGSLVLVTLERMPETTQDWVGLGTRISMFGISLVAAIVAAFVLAWYLPHLPYAGRLVLAPPSDEEDGEMDPLGPTPDSRASLLGAIGVAATTLRPAGKARFGDDYLDVIAEGDYVDPGSRVQVIEIEGNRIVVKEV